MAFPSTAGGAQPVLARRFRRTVILLHDHGLRSQVAPGRSFVQQNDWCVPPPVKPRLRRLPRLWVSSLGCTDCPAVGGWLRLLLLQRRLGGTPVVRHGLLLPSNFSYDLSHVTADAWRRAASVRRRLREVAGG